MGRGQTEFRILGSAALLAESLALVRAAEELPGLADCLESFAGLAAAGGSAADAAVLFGAAQALRDSIAGRRPPDQDQWYERHLEQARGELGDDGFSAQFERGRSLLLEDAIELAQSLGAPA